MLHAVFFVFPPFVGVPSVAAGIFIDNLEPMPNPSSC